VYLIFLTKFDIFREKHTIYHMERVIKETGTVVENGTHEIYVNTAIDDGTEIAKRMQYFKKSAGVHQKFQKLSKRVQYFKESQKGVTEMCELVEEYAKNYAEEYAKKYAEEEVKKAVSETEIKTALNMLKNGASVELVVKSLPSLSEQFVRELQAQLL
jgi:histone H3/H4